MTQELSVGRRNSVSVGIASVLYGACGSARNELLWSSCARSKRHFVATSPSLVHARSFLTPTPMEFDSKFGDRQTKFVIKRGALGLTGACRLPWSFEIGF